MKIVDKRDCRLRPDRPKIVHVDAFCVRVVNVRIDHRRQQVVRRGNRVKVAVEMEVDDLARQHLREAAARGPALDSEDRAQRRLAQRDDRFPAGTTVLPSPALVGVMAVTRISFPRLASGASESSSSLSLAVCLP